MNTGLVYRSRSDCVITSKPLVKTARSQLKMNLSTDQADFSRTPPPRYSYSQTHVNQPPIASYFNPSHAPPPSLSPAIEKFSRTRNYKDFWATILFLFFLLGFGACVALGIVYLKSEIFDKPQPPKPISKSEAVISTTDLGIVLGGSTAVGFISSFVYFLLIQR